jgi:nitrous oxide reductase accessory protein NosL
MTLLRKVATLALGALIFSSGCRNELDDGPPSIRLGDSLCIECGMIISDERFATATIVVGDRGNEPLLFDDFNCQMIFEAKQSELTIVDRWSHDYNAGTWLHTADAWFMRSEKLHTPMASHIAAFTSKDDAEAFAAPLDGETLDFVELWERE